MTVGLSITKCGSLVISVAAPAPKTRNRLNHCMVSIGFFRRNCQPIWASPSAMAVATDTARFFVARYRMRKSSVDAKSSSNSFAASRKYFMGDPIRFAGAGAVIAHVTQGNRPARPSPFHALRGACGCVGVFVPPYCSDVDEDSKWEVNFPFDRD